MWDKLITQYWLLTQRPKPEPKQKGCTLQNRRPDCWEHGCEGYEPCEVLERMKARLTCP